MQIIGIAFFNHRNSPSRPSSLEERGSRRRRLASYDCFEARFSSSFFLFFFTDAKKKKKRVRPWLFVLVDVIAHECKIVVNWSELGNHSSPWLRGRIAPSQHTTIFETVLINIANPAINLGKFQFSLKREGTIRE